MTRRTRKTIFYVLVVLFVLVGSAVVLYAEGWRINLSNFQTEKVGGIYVRAFPQSASITLDGKSLQNQSNFLSHGTLLSNLFPKNYILGLSMPGYDVWRENADVEPSLVVEMKYAVLVPQISTAVATTSNIVNFFEIGDDHVDQHANGTITWRNLAIATGTIMSHSTDLKNMIYQDPKGNYLVYDFTTQKTLGLGAIFQKQHIVPRTISLITIDPYNDTTALAVLPGRVWSIDLGTGIASTIGTASSGSTIAPFMAASQPFLAWSAFSTTADSSKISVYDKFAGRIAVSPINVAGATQGLAWITNDELGIVQSDGSLYIYTVSSNNLRQLASDVKAFYPTVDGNLIAALENESVEIFDFAGNDYYRFNLPDMADVKSLTWYKDETHLFVNYPSSVAFFDLADTSLINVTTISAGTISSYDPQSNALYLLNQGSINRFDFPN